MLWYAKIVHIIILSLPWRILPISFIEIYRSCQESFALHYTHQMKGKVLYKDDTAILYLC